MKIFLPGDTAAVLHVYKSGREIEKKLYRKKTDIDSKLSPMLIVPRDLTFKGQINLGASPHGSPQKSIYGPRGPRNF